MECKRTKFLQNFKSKSTSMKSPTYSYESWIIAFHELQFGREFRNNRLRFLFSLLTTLSCFTKCIIFSFCWKLTYETKFTSNCNINIWLANVNLPNSYANFTIVLCSVASTKKYELTLNKTTEKLYLTDLTNKEL